MRTMMEVLDIACEVEVRTKRRRAGKQANNEITDATKKRKMATSTQTSKPKSRRKPKEPQKPGAKRSKNKSSLLSPDQLNKVKKIDRAKLLAAVSSRVEGELFGELFPERIELWEHLKSGDRLLNLVTFQLKST